MTKKGGPPERRTVKQYAYTPTEVEGKTVWLDYYWSHQTLSHDYLEYRWYESGRSLMGLQGSSAPTHPVDGLKISMSASWPGKEDESGRNW